MIETQCDVTGGRRVLGLAAVLAACVIGLTACGGGGEAPGVATASSGPAGAATPAAPEPTADQERRFAECLRDEGVAMIEEPGAVPEIDKDNSTFEQVDKASKACARFAPTAELPDPPSVADLAKLREYAACMRENGVEAYPDPDPVTGDAGAEEALGPNIKTDRTFRAALEVCQQLRLNGSSDTVPGG